LTADNAPIILKNLNKKSRSFCSGIFFIGTILNTSKSFYGIPAPMIFMFFICDRAELP